MVERPTCSFPDLRPDPRLLLNLILWKHFNQIDLPLLGPRLWGSWRRRYPFLLHPSEVRVMYYLRIHSIPRLASTVPMTDSRKVNTRQEYGSTALFRTSCCCHWDSFSWMLERLVMYEPIYYTKLDRYSYKITVSLQPFYWYSSKI